MEDGCRCVLPLFVYIDICLALDELCDLLGALLTGEVRRGLLGHVSHLGVSHGTPVTGIGHDRSKPRQTGLQLDEVGEPGRVPFGTITPGSKIRLVVTSAGQNGTDDQQTGQIYPATMVSTSTSTIQGTGTIVNVDVQSSQAPQIAMMSAANRLALVKDSDQ